MRISVTKRSGVPVVDQIATQIMLAIVSGELRPDHRLPSIRALAARLCVHLNSVRAAYLSLEQRNWIELRRGSGAYVKNTQLGTGTAEMVRAFVDSARSAGLSDNEIRSAVDRVLSGRHIESVLVIEPEPELRKVLMAEIAGATSMRVDGMDANVDRGHSQVLVVALAARSAGAAPASSALTPDLWLSVNSPSELLQKQQRPASHSLVTFVSRSPDLLRIGRAVLMASGWTPEALAFKDARQAGWKRGLRTSAFVIADTITIREIPAGIEVKQIRVIAERSIAEIRHRCEDRA